MTDVGHDHHHSSNGHGAPSSPPSPPVAVFAVALVAGLVAAGAAYGLGDLLGFGVGAAIAVVGSAVAAIASTKSVPPDVKANALLDAVTAEDAPSSPPSRFRSEPWATLYLMAIGDAEAQRTATLAVQEVERLRRELEQKNGSPVAFVPSPSHGNDDLVGAVEGAESTPETSGSGGGHDRTATIQALTEALDPIRDELNAIERELEPVVASLRQTGTATPAPRSSTPAKMVDALVQTAADGIEDLAAGLMRASELAGVAERVTNRATLLALNAALEATRSGSEAFASIAEETRRLAEYAREATDTISRLSNEIEIKVGETMSSIQSSSEDAKAAVASMGSGTGAASHGVAPETVTAMQALLLRVRSLRERTIIRDDVPTVEPAAAADVTFVSAEVPAEVAAGAPVDAPSDAHTAFGSIAFGGIETPTPTPADGRVEPNEATEPEESGKPAESAEPPAFVAPKIPDWLEGIEPRHRG